MTQIWGPQALLPNGWARDVLIEIDGAGQIASVMPNSPTDGSSHRHPVARARQCP